jgi:hypothetical protein
MLPFSHYRIQYRMEITLVSNLCLTRETGSNLLQSGRVELYAPSALNASL